jgi:Spy/CpxP family protein refolding chaperone
MSKLGKIKILAVSALAGVVLAGSIALAQTSTTDTNPGQKQRTEWGGKGKHWGGRGGRGHGGMFRGVNLTEDQKARMKQIHESFNERTKSVREQLRAKRQELRQASEGGTFNESLATQKLQDMAGLEAKLMSERFNLRQETLSVLTAEQKTQLEQKRAEFKSKRGERRQR